MEFELNIEKDPETYEKVRKLLNIAVQEEINMNNHKEINLLKQLISLADLREAFKDCDEFDVNVSRFFLLGTGEVCTKFDDHLDETPNIAVYSNGKVFYCYGQGREEHVLTIHK